MSTQKHTPGPWQVAMMFGGDEPMAAPRGMNAEQRAKWDAIMAGKNKPMRHNDGSFIVAAGIGDERGPVADVKFQGKAKRGQGYATDDPVGLANARLIAAAPELLDIVKRLGVYLPDALQAEVDTVIAKATGA